MRIQNPVVVPAGGNSGNVLQGLVGSIIRDPSSVDLFAVADDTAGDISCSFLIDSEAVLINGGVPASLGTGIGPQDPQDVIVRNEAGPPGSILNLTFFNAGAAAKTVRYAVNINPLA
jgi:hypothetical protein